MAVQTVRSGISQSSEPTYTMQVFCSGAVGSFMFRKHFAWIREVVSCFRIDLITGLGLGCFFVGRSSTVHSQFPTDVCKPLTPCPKP